MDTAVANDASCDDKKKERSNSDFLSPKAFLEAVRCLDNVLNTRLNKLDYNNITPTSARPRSGLRTAMGTRITEHHATGQVIVNLRVLFMSISEIDTIKDNYSAEILLQSSWLEPKLDSRKPVDEGDDEIDWSKYWNPKIIVDNVFGREPADNGSMKLKRNKHTGQATVFETRLIKGRFYELMELYQFPFDVQFLTVTLTSDLDNSEIKLVANTEEPSGIGISGFSAEQEWKLAKDVKTWTSTKLRATGNQKTRHPVFSAAATVSRRPQFFIWNIITMMFLTCSLSFATFTVTLVKPENRLQLTFLLLLTTVTFKFAVNKILPKIPYLTFLDKYILGSLIIQFSICVWHAIVGSVIQDQFLTAITQSNASSAGVTRNSSNRTMSTWMTTQATPTTTTLIPPATRKATIADWIALGTLGGIYIVFQLVFLALIGTNTKKFIVQSQLENEQHGGK